MRLSPFAAATITTALAAQGRAVVPEIAASLPGNAAISMPLRWSHGALQVIVDAALLPPQLTGQAITGLRLRRPAFLGEPPYPAVQRTLTVRLGFGQQSGQSMSGVRSANWPLVGGGHVQPPIAAGPAVFAVAATAAPVPPQSLGSEFLVIPFTAPVPVVAGNLLLEIEAGDAPLQIGSQWVDAVWVHGGVDTGYFAPVGHADCTLRSLPATLAWNDAAGPQRGTDARLLFSGAGPAGNFVSVWIGLSPQTRPVGPTFFGYGGALTSLSTHLTGCQQWVPIDAVWGGVANAASALPIQFALPPQFTSARDRIGVQCAAIDLARPEVPLDLSNGVLLVLDRTGVGSGCATALFPGAATVSPWLPDVGLLPVLVLDY